MLMLLLHAVAIIILALALTRHVNRREPEVHTYNGTTYVDGQCFVDKAGTLWCQPIG
jgi:hypothetical protein